MCTLRSRMFSLHYCTIPCGIWTYLTAQLFKVFDVNTLKAMRRLDPAVPLVLLVYNENGTGLEPGTAGFHTCHLFTLFQAGRP